MFYERERSTHTRRRRHGCLSRFVKLALLLVFAWIVITAASSGTLSGLIHGMIPDGLPGGWRNVLLLGTDSMSSGTCRTDTMIVASVSTSGQVKLTSIMRDTLADIEGHGAHKINAAYAYGGAELAMKTVNDCFGLNISQYALVDFEGLAGFVDKLGGIEVNVTREEARAMNRKKGHKLNRYGENTLLDGIQAVRFARLRKIDSDYQRAGRQRRLLNAIAGKVRAVRNPVSLFSLAKCGLEMVETNISMPDLALLGVRILLNDAEIAQYRVPADGTYESGTKDGVWSIRADLKENRRLLHEFIYG